MDQKEIYKTLRETIIEILNQEEMSISSISKKLEKEGFKIHRLILTGYLQALRDLNILKEKEIQPSKIYTVMRIEEKNIYEILTEFFTDHPESGDLCVFVLYKFFKRPILKWEIDRCGASKPEFAERVYGESRKETIDVFDALGIPITKNMPAYVPKKDYYNEYMDIMTQLIIRTFNLQKYTINKKTQLKLDDSI
ncbi:MAG: hypothetical protein ACP5SF_03215 [Thermoplasmata archaeon]